MMRRLLRTTAVAAALTLPLGIGAYAQTATPGTGTPSTGGSAGTGTSTHAGPATGASAGKAAQHIRDDQVRASKLIGSTVYDHDNQKIGEINELVLDPDGKVADVVIGVGGFLGVGEKNVAVEMSELKRGQDNRVMIDKTKEQLQQAQNIDLSHESDRKASTGSSSSPRTGATPTPGAGGASVPAPGQNK